MCPVPDLRSSLTVDTKRLPFFNYINIENSLLPRSISGVYRRTLMKTRICSHCSILAPEILPPDIQGLFKVPSEHLVQSPGCLGEVKNVASVFVHVYSNRDGTVSGVTLHPKLVPILQGNVQVSPSDG